MTAARLTPRAAREALAATRWIAKDNPTAAQGLQEAIVAAAVRIGDHPHIGVARPELARDPYRFLPRAGYPYIIVYNAERRPPLIVRIVHGARDLPHVLRDP